MYQHVCYYCGKEFESRASQAHFCCRKCYIRNRFWKKEGLDDIVQCLEKGIPVTNDPGWLKDLIMGGEDTEIEEM